MSAETNVYDQKMLKTIEVVKSNFASVRAGRANAGVLDRITVEYYGTPTPLNQVAAISSPDPRTLVIQPWDGSLLKAVEKAIQTSDLGINPQNDGRVVRLAFPQLTEERRKDLTKQVRKYCEEGKVALRNIRRDAMEDFKKKKKAAEITEQQKAAEIELAEAKAAWTAELDASPLTIDVSQIADIVSVTSGVPVSSLTESESRRLLQAESVLKTRIIGQDEAVEAVAKAVRRSRSPLKDPRRPGGSFIFLGPTGTGKTELAKTLAEYLFGSKDALISFDMSEFGSEFEVSKLIGSPPGYVGHDEGGQLTKAVRRHPYSVVLFDEIEKAHPDIFNILLQVLEEGRLTDSQGKTVDFRNTVIIMTSNVGAREIAQDASVGFGTTGEQGLTSSEIRGRAMGELKRLFRPELLNRIDDIVVFQKLSGENLTKIAHLLVDDLRQRLIANGMNIKLTDAAYDKIVAEGTDLTNGARPLRRAIQKLIEDPLSEELLAGEWGEGDTVLCDVVDGKFVFSHGTGEIPAPRPAGALGGDTAQAAPHTGNAAPVSSGVSSGPGGMMQAGSGAL